MVCWTKPPFRPPFLLNHTPTVSLLGFQQIAYYVGAGELLSRRRSALLVPCGYDDHVNRFHQRRRLCPDCPAAAVAAAITSASSTSSASTAAIAAPTTLAPARLPRLYRVSGGCYRRHRLLRSLWLLRQRGPGGHHLPKGTLLNSTVCGSTVTVKSLCTGLVHNDGASRQLQVLPLAHPHTRLQGSYCPGGGPVYACPTGSMTAGTASTSAAACSLALSGYYLPPGSSVYAQCPAVPIAERHLALSVDSSRAPIDEKNTRSLRNPVGSRPPHQPASAIHPLNRPNESLHVSNPLFLFWTVGGGVLFSCRFCKLL